MDYDRLQEHMRSRKGKEGAQKAKYGIAREQKEGVRLVGITVSDEVLHM